ncbi:hypothetical protein C1H46_035148 [Malus baccata]|uniref:DUF7815 domain-containing protein n=1 Tax=Malus baccata TaxID=106549 RepID=A0A540KYK7_MALBA|nr:hypothetical protein C1H46_035148 [Malus baccata]
MEIPMDVIKQVQISLRKEANMSSYDPDDTPLPNLPSVEETLAELDPSPPYLRCKHCKGRLLRGVQTLTCVFCGRELCKDLPPDPINFRDTFGYRWLLQSLSLSGSEIVDLPIGANELNRGQTARKDELSLSDLLNLEIKWTSRPEKIETDLSNETPSLPKLPDLAGVNLDNFFFEGNKDDASSSSEELFGSNTQIVSKESFQGHETLSLFENVKPFETVVQTTEGESGDSGWAASFQFAVSESLPQASGNLPQASETLPRASENLPQASEKLPQASENLPQASETLPRASENLPQASEKLPQASENLPQASETLPRASENLPQASEKLPQASENLPQASETLPRASENLPQASEKLPQASENLPQASETLPRASENLPQASEKLPQASENLPQASETLPRASENLPQASEKLPQASENLPQASETLPRASENLPQASEKLPQASENLPQASETLPRASENLPQASEKLPQASENLPQASETLPRASENLPQASEKLPQASENLPQASETLPRASENLPQASEKLPQASENLPQASETLPQASESFPQESKSLDPFVGSTVDLSAHIDTVFGSVVDSTNEKSNHSLTGSTSMSTDWFQDDLLGVSNSGFSGGPEQFETLAEVKGGVQDNQLQTTSSKASDNKTTDKDDDSFDAWNDFTSLSSAPNLVDSSVKQNGVDWVQDNQLQTTSSKAPDNKTTDEDDDPFDAWNDFASSSNAPNVVDSSVKQSGVDWVQDNQLQTTVNKAADNKTTDADDDSFDAWNDFTSSNNASNLADSSVKQSNNQTTPVDHTLEVNLFGAASNSGDLDFGSFLQPDLSAGAFNSSSGSTVVDGAQPEPSVLDRLADASTNNGKKSEDVAGGGDVSSARAGSKSDDVERIMSQMHDLSFMLESTLSMPPKQDELHPPSKD